MKIVDFQVEKVDLGDKKYPKPLLDLIDPPKCIYFRGNLNNINFNKCLAVVGSRTMTNYGRQVVETFVPDLVLSNFVIVSGFMYGIDTQAHKICIENGGITVAVLGNGLDVIYPLENEKLYLSILENNGVILSEYPNDMKPHLWTYPKRNRLVAALSKKGTLVIEAGEKSGSLVTANWATKLKRNLYAVPGPVTSANSFGTNELIRQGKAKMTLSSSDITNEVSSKSNNESQTQQSLLEKKIYKLLENESLSLDELVILLGEDVSKVSTEISMMSLSGVISEISGKFYITNKK